MNKERLLSLPKWAQEMISNQSEKITELEKEVRRNKFTDFISTNMRWHFLHTDIKETSGLFILKANEAMRIATVEQDDILLVGHFDENCDHDYVTKFGPSIGAFDPKLNEFVGLSEFKHYNMIEEEINSICIN